jgi:hypothetical protein
LEQKLSKP